MKKPRAQAAPTKKAESTKRRIFDAALKSFVQKGYEKTTMRAIAQKAGTSLGLTYRYFKKKDDLVLELYRATCIELEDRVRALPAGDLSVRFQAAMDLRLSLITPYRTVFASVVAATMDPHGRAFALGEAAADVRARIVAAWRIVVDGSSDARELPVAGDLAVTLLVAELAILFLWLHDDTLHQARTRALIDEIAGGLHAGLGLLFLDENAARFAALVAILRPTFLAGIHAS